MYVHFNLYTESECSNAASSTNSPTPPVAVGTLSAAVLIQMRAHLVANVGAARRLGRAALCDTHTILPPALMKDMITE